jgi:hypothetical protein
MAEDPKVHIAGIDAATARELFLAAIDASPADPLAHLRQLAIPTAVRAATEELLRCYERSCALEGALTGAGGAIDRALESISPVGSDVLSHAGLVADAPMLLESYRVIREIGRGQGSVVLEAMQELPIARIVAIKIILGDASDAGTAARVSLERQILAELEHPNIARLYDFAIDSLGRPCLVMEYVRGGPLDEWCTSCPRDPRALIRDIFLPVCAAVRFAHGRGILHLDLKPANVLVQQSGDEVHPKVIDFGIARFAQGLSARAVQITEAPCGLGTLRWASPEALNPFGGYLDARTDVFGLGLILFELLARRPARILDWTDLPVAVERLLKEPIPRISSVVSSRSIDRDLDAIIAKACEREQDARYASVAELVWDLESWLAGREVRARPRRMGERVARSLRQAVPATVPFAAAAAIVVVLFHAMNAPVRAREAALVATASEAIADARRLRSATGERMEQKALLAEALGSTRALIELTDGGRIAVELRADALEEAIIMRLEQGESKADETRRLVEEFVSICERVRREDGSPLARARYSVALAYKYDVVVGTDEHEVVERLQVELDEGLHAEFPWERRYADNLCWTYQRIHDFVWQRGERGRAMELLRKSGAIGREILAKHGWNALTLATAQAGAWYEAFAAEVEWRPKAALESAERARAYGEALLEQASNHRRGAVFLLRAGIVEANTRLECGDVATALEVLASTRERAAPVISREAGVGLFGFPIAESWECEARCWLASAGAERVEHAIDELEREMRRESEAMTRDGAIQSFAGAVAALRVRAALAAGRVGEAHQRANILLDSAELDRSGVRGPAIEALALHLVEHRFRSRADDESHRLLVEVGRRLEHIRATGVPDPMASAAPALVDLAILGLRPDVGSVAALAAQIRDAADHNTLREIHLRRLERWIAGVIGRDADQRPDVREP